MRNRLRDKSTVELECKLPYYTHLGIIYFCCLRNITKVMQLSCVLSYLSSSYFFLAKDDWV